MEYSYAGVKYVSFFGKGGPVLTFSSHVSGGHLKSGVYKLSDMCTQPRDELVFNVCSMYSIYAIVYDL
jgi:hypothetical protein